MRSSLRISDPFFDRHNNRKHFRDVTIASKNGSQKATSRQTLEEMQAIEIAFVSQRVCSRDRPETKDHQDQSFSGINRLPAHAPLRAHDNYVDARNSKVEEGWKDSTFFRLLTPAGTRWKFKFFHAANLAPLASPGGNGFAGADNWKDIPVPMSWECAGHGQPIYTNFIYPFKCDPPHIPDSCNHVGCYQTNLEIPLGWDGRRIFLYFEGVSAAFHCWLDGEFVGYSSDSFCPAEFDVTRFVRSGGSHVLSVRVLRYCEGSYMESQDMWWLSGIQRDVILYSKPAAAHIWDFKVTTELVGTGSGQAELAVQVQVNSHNTSSAAHVAKSFAVKATLLGPHQLTPGDTAAVPPSSCDTLLEEETISLVPLQKKVHRQPKSFQDAPNSVCIGQLRQTVGGVKPWSPHAPWLYTLVLALEDDSGRCVDAEVCRVGMRTVRIEDGVLRVNSEEVEVRGVNRHEHDAHKGKFCGRDLMVTDIRLMKQLNFNAVRCSHYPNRTLWYDLCTAYGLWVVNEANLETNGLVAFLPEDFLAVDRSWRQAYLDRMSRMVLRDRNHACCIVWSLGNESSYGPNIAALAHWTRQVDPTRPLQYESCGGASATDIICPMYPSPDDLRKLGTSLEKQNLKSTAIARRWPTGTATRLRPVLMCEYAHAMNNSVGNFDAYWEVIRAHRHVQGGFIWDWVDQGLASTDGQGREFWAYGGDFGEAVHDNDWHINGLLWPDRSPHPAAFQVKKTQQPVQLSLMWASPRKLFRNVSAQAAMRAELQVTHRQSAGSMEGVGWRWRVEVDGEVLVESGDATPLPPAKAKTSIEFPLSAKALCGGKEAMLTVQAVLLSTTTWAEAGHELAWEQSVVPAELVAVPEWQPWETQSMTVTETSGEVVVEGPDGLRAVWSKPRGGLCELSVRGKKVVGGGKGPALVHNFWRAQTSNDNGGSDTLKRYGATEQKYSTASGFDRPEPRSKAIIRNVVAWLSFWGDVSYGGQWEQAGLNRLHVSGARFRLLRRTVSKTGAEVWAAGCGCAVGMVWVEVSYTLRASGNATKIPCRTTYRVGASGEMVLDNHCFYSTMLPPPARVGIELTVPGSMRTLRWYGRGPHETYPDRCGVAVGQHEQAVDDTFVRYIVPQENGNKCETRWAALVDKEGSGLVISKAAAGETFNVSAHRFRATDLYTARHCKDVPTRKDITVTVDHAHTATGGNTSWTRSQLPQWMIPRGSHSYSIRLTPISSHDQAARPPPPPEGLQAKPSSFHAPPPMVSRWHDLVWTVSQAIGHSPISLVENILEVVSWKATPFVLSFVGFAVLIGTLFFVLRATIHQ